MSDSLLGMSTFALGIFVTAHYLFKGVIAWPVAKLLEFVLGSHHGIIYRRAELKELIAMHSSHAIHGGDLKTDTVTIIGATLDLQEKVVKQVRMLRLPSILIPKLKPFSGNDFDRRCLHVGY